MRLSSFFFLAILASLPVQLGKFFWPDFSYVLGIPIDYRAVTLYFTDFLLIFYLIFFSIENFKNFQAIAKNRRTLIISLVLINLYLFANAIFIGGEASIYFSLKFLEFSLFGFFASLTLEIPEVYRSALKVLALTVLWQSGLVVSQFVLQRSLGLWFLGERSFDSSTVGIAHGQILTKQFLRPYGTFPHPNVAAAFFAISMIILASQKRIFATLAFLVMLLTFSKSAILAIACAHLAQTTKLKYFLLSLAFLTVLVLAFLKSLPESQVASIAERLVLSQAALDISLKNPFFGVGSSNFISELAKLNLTSLSEVRLLQPVHNVFLLILAEEGIVGLLLFTIFLLIVLKSSRSPVKIALFVAILIFASVDHFFWTLNQGKLLFWLATSFILSSPAHKDSARVINRT